MFKLFRRTGSPKTETKPAAQRADARSRPAKSRPAPFAITGPAPLPEVYEDHDESAWSLWEQSQFQLDSQLGPLSPADSVRVRQETPSQMGELDPFERVGKSRR